MQSAVAINRQPSAHMDDVIFPVIRLATHLAEKAFAATQLKEDCHDLGCLVTALAACLKTAQACFSESEGQGYDRQHVGELLQVCNTPAHAPLVTVPSFVLPINVVLHAT
jgi:hypothetical protein